ncbi:YceI family protein [Siphonobacter curvatus]|uniref:Lipid-binding protein n=1 Tax=Siphonobacter curvatus TaxID=2094562 RepID=A0A2S7IGA6_9BACT|nr:YceI family protein [Siphonobacter curvatus]PQA54457.1 lipid-binding protein [Siphonobacter curvatus]
MKKILALLALTSLAFTKPQATVSYKVDTQKSTVVWKGKKVTGEHFGNVSLSSGTLTAENGKLKGGTFETDLRTLTVTDLKEQEYNQKLVNHLKGDDFFAVDKHPKSTFVITSVTPQSGNQVQVKGKLTIKGITKEVSFPATVKADKAQLTATAKIPVDRTQYDIKFRSTNFFENLGDKAIHNDFELDINLVANATGSATASR